MKKVHDEVKTMLTLMKYVLGVAQMKLALMKKVLSEVKLALMEKVLDEVN